jgi:hypothetical protein
MAASSYVGIYALMLVHVRMLVSSAEKHGLMDSIFTGYKVIPLNEIGEEAARR